MTVAAVRLFGRFREQVSGQPRTEAAFQLSQSVSARLLEGLGGAGAHRSQAVEPRFKERSLDHLEGLSVTGLARAWATVRARGVLQRGDPLVGPLAHWVQPQPFQSGTQPREGS
jgi:hypothetical protein